MVPVDSQAVVQINPTIADLFVGDGAFRFTDGPEAYQSFSRKLSQLYGRPVAVVNLGDLPHGYANPHDIPAIGQPAFTPAQIDDRQATLRRLVEASLPAADHDVLTKFRLAEIAACASQTASTLSDHQNNITRPVPFQTRLDGDYVASAAIILMPDRRWSAKTKWSYLTGLPEDQITHYPEGDGVDVLTLGHELSHLEQKTVEAHTSAGFTGSDNGGLVKIDANSAGNVMAHKERRWRYESDADMGSDDKAALIERDPRVSPDMAKTIHEARLALPLARALSRFGMSPEFYGTGLALRGHQTGMTPLPFNRHCEAVDEVLVRVVERRQGLLAPGGALLSESSDSTIVHNTTNGYRLGQLQDMSLLAAISSACDGPKAAEQRVPLLHTLLEVVKSEPITDRLVLEEAGLVLEGAQFFAPHIFAAIEKERRLESGALSAGASEPALPRAGRDAPLLQARL